MKKISFVKILAFFAIVSTFPLFANAQCNSFTKKKCMPQLAPYVHNGQLNSTSLAPGEVAELMMTFYSGQDYRILVCAQEVLGEVGFKVMDSEKNVLFNSKEKDNAKFWDFNVKSTQQLIIEVSVPEVKSSPSSVVQTGCISVLVGFKNK
jgi:hypothetical protein